MNLHFHAIVSKLKPIDSMAYHGHSPKLSSLFQSKFNEEYHGFFKKANEILDKESFRFRS